VTVDEAQELSAMAWRMVMRRCPARSMTVVGDLAQTSAPEQAKGLEFDPVIIVDPAGIEQAAARGRADLYVALTRTTRRLGLVGPGEMPRDLKAMLDRS
jgi:DNA helicase IV